MSDPVARYLHLTRDVEWVSFDRIVDWFAFEEGRDFRSLLPDDVRARQAISLLRASLEAGAFENQATGKSWAILLDAGFYEARWQMRLPTSTAIKALIPDKSLVNVHVRADDARRWFEEGKYRPPPWLVEQPVGRFSKLEQPYFEKALEYRKSGFSKNAAGLKAAKEAWSALGADVGISVEAIAQRFRKALPK